MNLGSIVNDELLWNAITTYTLGRARSGHGDFQLKLNCPMCLSRGQSQDKKYRCGIIRSGDHIGVHCFNCGFASKFIVGSPISHNMMAFLENIGVPQREIKYIQFHLREIARFAGTVQSDQQPATFTIPSFQTEALPAGSQSLEAWADLGCDNPDYLAVITYLLSRGDLIAAATSYYWTPDATHGLNRRLIIPCYHEDRIIGWIGRSIDPIKQKYYKQLPKNFLFNSRFMTIPNRKYVFIVEGAFDALAIDGIAALGASLNDQQIRWINQCDKIPVIVPDRDKAGKQLIDIGIEQHWAVAIPNYRGRNWWHPELKDADAAVAKHGKLFVIRSIIASMTDDPQIIIQRSNCN